MSLTRRANVMANHLSVAANNKIQIITIWYRRLPEAIKDDTFHTHTHTHKHQHMWAVSHPTVRAHTRQQQQADKNVLCAHSTSVFTKRKRINDAMNVSLNACWRTRDTRLTQNLMELMTWFSFTTTQPHHRRNTATSFSTFFNMNWIVSTHSMNRWNALPFVICCAAPRQRLHLTSNISLRFCLALALNSN